MLRSETATFGLVSALEQQKKQEYYVLRALRITMAESYRRETGDWPWRED